MDPVAFQADAFQNNAFQVGVAIVVVLLAVGKYEPEHDSALVDLAAARGFSSEHASAKADLGDAGV
jgi:hypothetical protein